MKILSRKKPPHPIADTASWVLSKHCSARLSLCPQPDVSLTHAQDYFSKGVGGGCFGHYSEHIYFKMLTPVLLHLLQIHFVHTALPHLTSVCLQLTRPYLIDFMFHGFPSENCAPGGR